MPIYEEQFKMDVDAMNIFENNNTIMPGAEVDRTKNKRPPSNIVTFMARKSVQQAEGIDISAKVLDIDSLISKINPETLLEYLQKINTFLKSNDNELEFPNLLEEMEDILIRVVENVSVLSSPKMYTTCKQVSDEIVNIMNHSVKDKNYMVVCVYKPEIRNPLLHGLGVESDNTLVYKKLYYTQKLNKDKFASISSLSSTPPISRSSSMDSLDRSPNALPSDIHIKPLYLILEFVKDITRPNLKLTDLTQEQAEYIHTVFSSIISNTTDDLRYMPMCMAIYEAVQIFALKFDFSIEYLESSGDAKTLLLEKTAIENESSNSGPVNPKRVKKQPVKKSVQRFKQFITSIPSEFILQSLQKISNFLSDETEASIVFTMLCPERRRFLKNIVNYCRSPDRMAMFPEEQLKILDVVKLQFDTKTAYKIKIRDVKRPCGETHVLFIKVPTFDKPAPESRPWYPKAEVLRKAPHTKNTNKKESAQTVPGFAQAKTTASTHTWSQQYGSKEAQSSQQPASTSKPTVKLAQGKNINFQSAGVMGQSLNSNDSTLVLDSERDPVLVEVMKKYDTEIKDLSRNAAPKAPTYAAGPGPELTARPGRGVNRGQAIKTIEALSVPVKCDKAMKMMKGMGWDGGALGSKGQGITEPLMPHISGLLPLVPNKVNLPKPFVIPKLKSIPTPCVSNNPRSPEKFRRQFMTHMLELLQSDEESLVLNYHPVLNKKEKYFLKNCLKNLSTRSRMTMAQDAGIMKKVTAVFAKDRDLMVSACISHNKTLVTLKKYHCPPVGTLRVRSTKWSETPELKESLLELVADGNIDKILDSCSTLYHTQKTRDSMRFRLTVLFNMLNFVKDKQQNDLTMKFEAQLSEKYVNFLRICINGVNNRVKFGSGNPEVALALEIIQNVGNVKVKLVYGPGYTSFTVSKLNNVKKKYQVKETSLKYDEMNKSNIIKGKTNDTQGQKTDINHGKATDNKNKVTLKIQEENNIASANYSNEVNMATEDKIKTLNGDEDSLDVDSDGSKLDTSDELMYFGSAMSISDNSAYTNNLDYSEPEDVSMCELKTNKNGDKYISDKLDLSNNKNNTNIKHGSLNISEIEVTFMYLSKTYFLTKEMPKYIQGLISLNILQKQELPLLKCHGVHNDALVYSCHTKKSLNWLRRMCIANNINFFIKEFDKMSLKINSYFEFEDEYFFSMLELYNKDICTKEWCILNKHVMDDCVIFEVIIDKKSFNHILISDLSLYAGVDKVTFSIIWE